MSAVKILVVALVLFSGQFDLPQVFLIAVIMASIYYCPVKHLSLYALVVQLSFQFFIEMEELFLTVLSFLIFSVDCILMGYFYL